MAVSKRLRFEILKRDDHACRYCGACAPYVVITVDHVVPVALGGTDLPENLVAACKDCNAGKSSVPADAPLVADVAAYALRWSKAMQVASEFAEFERIDRDNIRAAFLAHWEGFTYGGTYRPKPIPIESEWPDSIDRFIAAGLTVGDLLEAVNIAMRNQGVRAEGTWRYFCGVAWRMLSDRQSGAQRIASSLAADEGA